jgi:hypothetical protein
MNTQNFRNEFSSLFHAIITTIKSTNFKIAIAVAVLLCGVEYWNYMHISLYEGQRHRLRVIASALPILFFIFTSLTYLILDNWRKADKIFWWHFALWMCFYTILYILARPGFWYSDAAIYLSLLPSNCNSEQKLWLFGHDALPFTRYWFWQCMLIPYYDFYMVIQYTLASFLVAFTASVLYARSKSILILCVFGIGMLFAIPFHFAVLMFSRDSVSTLILALSSVILFVHLSIKKNEEVSWSFVFFTGCCLCALTQIRSESIVLIVLLLCIIFMNNLLWNRSKLFRNGVLAGVIIFVMTATLYFTTAWHSGWYTSVQPFFTTFSRMYYDPEFLDSNPEETKRIGNRYYNLPFYEKTHMTNRGIKGVPIGKVNVAWDAGSQNQEFLNLMLRIIKENPGLFLKIRFHMALYQANIYPQPLSFYGMSDYNGDVATVLPRYSHSWKRAETSFKALSIPSHSTYSYIPRFKKIFFVPRFNWMWSHVPYFIILVSVLLMNYFVPKAACITLPTFANFCIVFLGSPGYIWVYTMSINIIVLFVLPLALSELIERYYLPSKCVLQKTD